MYIYNYMEKKLYFDIFQTISNNWLDTNAYLESCMKTTSPYNLVLNITEYDWFV